MKLSESISTNPTTMVASLTKGISERSAAIGLSVALAMGASGCDKKNDGYQNHNCVSVENKDNAAAQFALAMVNKEAGCISSFERGIEEASEKKPRYVIEKMIENDRPFLIHHGLYLKVVEKLMEKPDEFDKAAQNQDELSKSNMELVDHSIKELKAKWGDQGAEILEAARLLLYGKMLSSLEKIQVPANLQFMMDNLEEIDDVGARDAVRLHVVWILTSSLYDHMVVPEDAEKILSILNSVEKKTARSDEKERYFFQKMGHVIIMEPVNASEIEKRMKEFTAVTDEFPKYADMIRNMEYIASVREKELKEFSKDNDFQPEDPTSMSLLFALGRSNEDFTSLIKEDNEKDEQ